MEIEKLVVTQSLRIKLDFLSHLKIGSYFYFVEVDICDYISPKTYDIFKQQIEDRIKTRKNVLKQEERYHDLVKMNSIYEENIKLSKTLSYNEQIFISNINTNTSSNINEENVEFQDKVNNEDFNADKPINDLPNENEKKSKKSDLSFLINGGTIEEINKNKKIEKEIKSKKEEIDKITDELKQETNNKLNKKVSKNAQKKRKFMDLNVGIGVGLNFDND